MRTISLQISDKEFNSLGLVKEQMLFSEFKELFERQITKKAISNCINIAKNNNLDLLTLDEINAEINAVRKCKK